MLLHGGSRRTQVSRERLMGLVGIKCGKALMRARIVTAIALGVAVAPLRMPLTDRTVSSAAENVGAKTAADGPDGANGKRRVQEGYVENQCSVEGAHHLLLRCRDIE